jgi:hypothetical protein
MGVKHLFEALEAGDGRPAAEAVAPIPDTLGLVEKAR